MNSPNFLLLLISNFIPLWLESMFYIILILLNILTLALWSSIWSVLENVPCILQKDVYSILSGESHRYISLVLVSLQFCVNLLFLFWFSVWYWKLQLLLLSYLFLHSTLTVVVSCIFRALLLGACKSIIIINSRQVILLFL